VSSPFSLSFCPSIYVRILVMARCSHRVVAVFARTHSLYTSTRYVSPRVLSCSRGFVNVVGSSQILFSSISCSLSVGSSPVALRIVQPHLCGVEAEAMLPMLLLFVRAQTPLSLFPGIRNLCSWSKVVCFFFSFFIPFWVLSCLSLSE